ncbi:MAG: hypothetical protein LUD72_00500 [Bacteroidales bacterium]|nr:hypothetical protein [Bacteroidales bacterium]
MSELYDEIYSEIERKLKSDKTIQRIQRKVDKGTATHLETEEYAKRLGEITSKALQDHLTEDALPDGNLSYGIAKATVGKTLRDNFTRVNVVGKDVQLSMNIGAGIGLMAKGAVLNADRIEGLVSNMDNCHLLEDARELMGEPVINTTQSFADDLVKENADFHYEVGLSPQVVRTADAGCCEWCENLEGTYDYPVEDEDVYHRHEYCKCVVTYHPSTAKFQDVWTKKEYRDSASMADRQAQIEARRNYGL